MPRGIKGSGKSRTPVTRPEPQRRRGRKKGLLAEAIQSVESPPAETATIEPSSVQGAVPGPLATEAAQDQERAPEVQDQPMQPPELAAAEADLVRRYPHAGIKPGSLRAGTAEGWGSKRIATIVCRDCQVKERTVATSDLFHVSRCEECAKAAKKTARNARK